MQFNVAQLLKESTGARRRYELSEALEELDPELTSLGLLRGELNHNCIINAMRLSRPLVLVRLLHL